MKKKPSDLFVVLRPVPSKGWKQAVKRAAKKAHMSQGQYLVQAVSTRLSADGYLPKPAAPPSPQEAAE